MRPIYASLTTALFLSASPALATPADDFVSALKDFAKQGEATLTVGETEGSGEDFVLKDLLVEGEYFTGKVAETHVDGYSDTGEGGRADRLHSTGISYDINDTDFNMTIDEIEVIDLNMPTGNIDTFNTNGVWNLSSSQMTKNFVANMGDKQVVIAPEFVVTNVKGDDGYTSKAEAKNVEIKLGEILTGGAAETIRQMDYETLTANMSGTTHYNPTTGVVESDDTVIAVDNAMSYKTTFRISGYTDQFAKQMAEWNKTYATPEAKNSEEALAKMMPMLKQLKLEHFTVDLTDDSLTGKLLDFQGKQMGTTGEQLAEAAPMFIGMSLGQLQMPEFSQMVSSGVAGFLKDKGTLTISLKPEEPVSVEAIMQASQTDPKQLPDLLGLSITSSK